MSINEAALNEPVGEVPPVTPSEPKPHYLDAFEALPEAERLKHFANGTKPEPKDKPSETAETPVETASESEPEKPKEPPQLTAEERSERDRKNNDRRYGRILKENARLAAELESLKKSAERPQAAKPAESAPARSEIQADLSGLTKPRLEDSANWEEHEEKMLVYNRALLKLELKAERDAEKETATKVEREREQAEELEDLKATWMKNSTPVREKNKEFDKLVKAAWDHIEKAHAPHLLEAILAMPEGPELMLQFGAKPELADELFDMSEKRSLVRLGQLAFTLKAPQPKTVTDAPRPPANVGGRASVGGDPLKAAAARFEKSRNPADLREWNRIANENLLASKGIRK